MQDPRKQKKGFDPAAFQAAAKAGQQQAYLQQNLDPDTKAKLEAVLNDKERIAANAQFSPGQGTDGKVRREAVRWTILTRSLPI